MRKHNKSILFENKDGNAFTIGAASCGKQPRNIVARRSLHRKTNGGAFLLNALFQKVAVVTDHGTMGDFEKKAKITRWQLLISLIVLESKF